MRVIWSAEARAQEEAAWHFLSNRNVAYADRVEQRVEARVATLAHAPHQGRPLANSDLRLLSVPDIQYVIAYRLEAEIVRVMGLWSTAQDVNR